MPASLATIDAWELTLTQNFLTDQPLADAEQTRYLRFSMFNYQFLIPLGSLQEIFRITRSSIVPVPEVASAVLGIYNWRGGLAWMIDLCDLLTGEVLTINLKEIYLTLLLPLKGQSLGLLVGQVDRIESFDSATILPISLGMIENIAPEFISGYFLDSTDTPLLLLNPDAIERAFTQA